MKKVLLGSTALLSAALVAGPALAQLEVTVGGSVKFSAGYVDDDLDGVEVDTDVPDGDLAIVTFGGPDRQEFDFQSEADIQINADGVADNGLRYGALVDLSTSTSDSNHVDETNIYLSGSWGRLEFGDQDSASDSMGFYTPGDAGTGGVWGNWTDWGGWDYDSFFKPLDSSDSTKVTYYTPRFGGFQFGLSYAPFSDSGESVVTFEDSRTFEDWIEAGANYTGTFGDFSVGVAATYTMADAGADTTVRNGQGDIVGAEDVSAWSVSTELGWRNFTFGGTYVDQGDSQSFAGADTTLWGIGATYGQGPWEVGINYVDADFDGRYVEWLGLGEDMPTDSASAIGAGASYTLAPGLALLADFVWFETDGAEGLADPAGAPVSLDNDGWVAVTAIEASF